MVYETYDCVWEQYQDQAIGALGPTIWTYSER
jgi:hypothetical protein